MSEKSVRLYIVGEGDALLQSLIEKGLSEIGRQCESTMVNSDFSALLDTISDEGIPVLIKPYPAA